MTQFTYCQSLVHRDIQGTGGGAESCLHQPLIRQPAPDQWGAEAQEPEAGVSPRHLCQRFQAIPSSPHPGTHLTTRLPLLWVTGVPEPRLLTR